MRDSTTRREWRASGEYGYYVVYEYHPDKPGNGTYGGIRGLTRKRAEEVAAALNTAYSQGISRGARAVTHSELPQPCCEDMCNL